MHLRLITGLGSLLLMCAGIASAQARFDFEQTKTVLPKSVLPTHVHVRLDLDPTLPTFQGNMTASLRVRETVIAVVLHARDLHAATVSLVSEVGMARPLSVTADDSKWQWRLAPSDGKPIAPGAYRLHIQYTGKIQQTGEGLFLVQHRAAGQSMRTLATQLQATSARQVFPSFDEPVFRTPFSIEVRAPAELSVLSNMPLQEAPLVDGVSRIHRFAPTPSMPSYLVAVAVGQFDVLEGSSGSIPLRIYTAPGKAQQAKFAMKATQDVLPYFADYFGVPYALPKLDQLAVPGVRGGAMEDWGMISYIEDLLLFDETRSSPARQRLVFSLVAHEIAHQWFGNLVSVASWDEIWLNEAFATWMQKKASEHFHPEWQTRLYERIDIDGPLNRDATGATRAVRGAPVSEDSVFEVFDDITYSKGGAVLSMLEQWVGPEKFQRGLASYMADRAFGAATAGDLWHNIGKAARLPVSKVAASWTNQKGFPLLQVNVRCEGGQTRIVLRQRRFSLGEVLEPATWQVPVTLARGKKVYNLLMVGKSHRMSLPGCEDKPLLVNAGGMGYFRVDYDTASRARLVAAFADLEPVDRLTLLSDSFALVVSGRRSVADHWAIVDRVAQINDTSRAALFAQTLRHWQELDDAFSGTPGQAAIRAAGIAFFAPELSRLGWSEQSDESAEIRSLRAGLISGLSSMGHAETIAGARERFLPAMAADTSQVSGSIRSRVIRAVGREARDVEFEALWIALHKAESREERNIYLRALCSGSDLGRARRLLAEALSGRLPPDVSLDVVMELGSVPALTAEVYAFALANWEALAQLGGEGPFGGRNWMLPGIVSRANDAAIAQRLRADQQRLAGPVGMSTALSTAAAIQVRARLRDREAAKVASSLRAFVQR